jgi:hypothetical protein
MHHKNQIYNHADLIFTDIEHHALQDKTQKNRSLAAAYDFFIYHYDDDYYREVHQLIVKEIHQLIGSKPVIVVDNFNQLNSRHYKFFLDFTKITEIQPGRINHCSRQGNIDICHRILDIIDVPETVLPMVMLKSLRLAEFDYLYRDDPALVKLNPEYPYTVTYKFNSRGYRDAEWPDDLSCVKNSNWCIGDSAIVGLGAPIEHSWPAILESKLNNRTIKVAMVGASNNWIFRQAEQILKEIQPKLLVIQWSYFNRRELDEATAREQRWQAFYNAVKDSNWPECTVDNINLLAPEILDEIEHYHHYRFDNWVYDEDRVLNYDITSTAHDNVNYTVNRIKQIEAVKNQTNVIHILIPEFGTDEEISLTLDMLDRLDINYFVHLPYVDYARDNGHCDIMSNQIIVEQILTCINNADTRLE